MAEFKKSGLLANTAAYATGNLAQQATNFILLFLLAGFLSPRDLGITSTLSAYGAILSLLISMQLHGAISRFYWEYKNEPVRLKNYIGSIWLFQITLGFLIIGFLAVWPGWWETWQMGKPFSEKIPFWPYVPLALAGVFFVGVTAVPLSLLQARQEARSYVLISAARLFISGPLSLLLVMGYGMGAMGMLLAQAGAGLVVAVLVVGKYRRACFPHQFCLADIKEAAKFSLPLVPHSLAAWMLLTADRAVLERYGNLAAVGAYGLAVTVSMCVESLAGSINAAWQPHYFKVMKEDGDPLREIRRCLILYGVGYGMCCLFAIMFAGEVMYFLLPAKHQLAITFVAPLLLARLWGGWYYFASTPLFFYKKTKIIPILTAFSALTGFSLNIWLIPKYGAAAAAWNSVFTVGFMMVLFHGAAVRHQKLPFPWLAVAVIAVCSICGALISWNFPQWSLAGLVLKIFILSIAVIFCWILMRNHVKFRGSVSVPEIPGL